MPLVTSGVEHGNLRELALARMKDLGTQCRDVRTREVGIQEIHHKVRPYQVWGLLVIFAAGTLVRDGHEMNQLISYMGIRLCPTLTKV